MNHHLGTPKNDAPVDPVCGMSVEPASAAASRVHDGNEYFFCSTYCAEEFDANPAKYLTR